eukprot:14741532-Alexandrium_andersonii.AAC.1
MPGGACQRTRELDDAASRAGAAAAERADRPPAPPPQGAHPRGTGGSRAGCRQGSQETHRCQDPRQPH